MALAFAMAAPQVIDMKPVLATEQVGQDADDPAVWIHPTDPQKSLILGTIR
jgi:3-phytase